MKRAAPNMRGIGRTTVSAAMLEKARRDGQAEVSALGRSSTGSVQHSLSLEPQFAPRACGATMFRR